MRNVLLASLLSFSALSLYSQGTSFVEFRSGVPNQELQSILYFEGINAETVLFKGPQFAGKDYEIRIREFVNGKLKQVDTIFNSTEHFSFKVEADSFQFKTLTKELGNSFKIEFQFNGFRKGKSYRIEPKEMGSYALKDFAGDEREKQVDIKSKVYLFAYMMPFVRKDKSTAYCEVAQSGTNPEKLYDVYKIPHYFLVEMEFFQK